MSENIYWSADQLAAWINSNRTRLLVLVDQRLGSQLRRRVEADDILQDASGRALQSAKQERLTGDDPYAWFCQIIERQIVDAHRFHFGAQKRDAGREVSGNAPAVTSGDGSQAEFFELLAASFTTPSKAFSRNIRFERLNSALQELPEETRQAIRWRYLEGVSGQEIAQRLGKSHGAVRVLLTRSLKKLEQVLEDLAN